MKADLLIKNAQQLVAANEKDNGSTIISEGAVACYRGKIVAVGTTKEVLTQVELVSSANIIDAREKVVTPGFVDPHTHPVFWGTREGEFVMRIQGKSYREIAEAGGGSAPVCVICGRLLRNS